MTDWADRRQSQRIEALLKVTYEHAEDLLSDYLTNVGEGGIFIHTNLPFGPNEQISFTISFPGLLEPIRMDGVVRWRQPRAQYPGEAAGLGVQFVFSNTEQKERILSLINRLRGTTGTNPAVAGPFRVLLVEDNHFALELFEYAVHRTFSKQKGVFEVLLADDGGQALETLRTEEVDLAIIDHFLPSLTGCELVQYMRRQPRLKDIPALIVSVGGAEVKAMAQKSGADMYLDKPVLHKDLMRTISKLLSVRRTKGGDVDKKKQQEKGV